MISLDDKKARVFENTVIYFQKPIENLDIQKLEVIISGNENNYFQLLYNYSYDKINYSEFVLKPNFLNPDNLSIPCYISILLKRNEITDLQKPLTLYQTKNVNSSSSIILESISYNDELLNIFDESECKSSTTYEIINQFPKWNFYDNQNITINRWLQQCNSIAEMYGHTCIYFKTEPIESETIHTFKNHVFRNVVNVKKLHIIPPGNEFPQDRVVFSEWDQALQDDFIIHIVVDKFEQAFGENKIPIEKDYLFIPLLNKLFRVATSQPKNSFMGKIGWWEVFLSKFEEDETVLIDPALKTSMELNGLFNEELDSMDIFDNSLSSEIFNELTTFENDTVETKEKNDFLTVEEKKQVNQNYTNKLTDSIHYVSLKETEKLREFYDNRLKLVSVNPDSNSFPITMYDNSAVPKRVMAMQYVLGDYSTKNKFSLNVIEGFQLSFNYVLLTKFVGELFDIISNNVVLFTLSISRNKIEIIDNRNGLVNNFLVDFGLNINEIYNIVLEYNLSINQLAIKIFSLKNKEKNLEYQNIYINEQVIIPFLITHIQMFGGNYYSNEIIFKINKNVILKDYTNPLLLMKNI